MKLCRHKKCPHLPLRSVTGSVLYTRSHWARDTKNQHPGQNFFINTIPQALSVGIVVAMLALTLFGLTS